MSTAASRQTDVKQPEAWIGELDRGPDGAPDPVPHTGAGLDRWVFQRLAAIAREHGGIALRPGKEALVSARVAKRQRALGIATAKQYLHYLEADASGSELSNFLDAITTNVTSFFREADHLEQLGRHVDRLLRSGVRRLRMWSAACASGEEAYSMAMSVLEACDGRELDFKLLATDISTPALARARAGLYSAERVAGLSRMLRTRYFERVGRRGEGDEMYRVREPLRSVIVFKRLNLARPPFPMRGPLHAVFCRNVMIYLDQPTRAALLAELERLIGTDGLLMIGHSESLAQLPHRLISVGASVYAASPQGPRSEGARP